MKKAHLLTLIGAAFLVTSCATAVAVNDEGGFNPPTPDTEGGQEKGVGEDNPRTLDTEEGQEERVGEDNPTTSCEITFDLNGGTVSGSDDPITVSVVPTTYWYYAEKAFTEEYALVVPHVGAQTFKGFSLKKDDPNVIDKKFVIESDMYVYAYYAPIETEICTINWVDSEETDPDKKLLDKEIYYVGEAPTFKKTVPSHTGKTFVGWDGLSEHATIDEDDKGKTYTFTTQYAQSAKFHILTLDYNITGDDSDFHTQQVFEGLTATEPKISKVGYKLSNWTYVSGGTGTFEFETTPITADVSIEANWTQDTYTITYVTNGGTISGETTTATYGDTLDKPTLTRAGYDPSEVVWYSTPTFTSGTEFYFNQDAPTHTATTIINNVTLYAKWGDITQFEVEYYDDSATPVEYTSLTEMVDYGQKPHRPADPVKDNCTFVDWYTDTTYATEFDFDDPITSGDTDGKVKVYAKFAAITCRVTYVGNGGTFADEDYAIVNKGETVLDAPVVYKEDYANPTWYWTPDFQEETEFKFGTVAEGATVVNNDITLYAKYEIKEAYSFTDDSWLVFLNAIENKTFTEIAEEVYGSDYQEHNNSFVGLERSIVIEGSDGGLLNCHVYVADENKEAGANDAKFTFIITELYADDAFDRVNNFYPTSDIRRITEEVYYRLPDLVKERIVSTQQTCYNAEPDEAPETITTKVFIPSARQVYGTTIATPEEGTQLPLFNDQEIIEKYFEGMWTRSPYNNTRDLVYCVSDEHYDNRINDRAICPLFVIK